MITIYGQVHEPQILSAAVPPLASLVYESIDALYVLRHALSIKMLLHPHTTILSHLRAQGWIVDQRQDILRQLRDISWR